MSRILLSAGTLPQLRHFATTTLGLEIPPTANTAVILSKIKAAHPDLVDFDAIDVAPTADDTVKNPAKRADLGDRLSTHYSDDPKVMVIIPALAGKLGSRDVPLNVNGDQILVQRNKEVELPYRFLECLRKALEEQYDQTPARPNEPAEFTRSMVQSYPFQLLDVPSRAEIAGWDRRMMAAELGEGQKAAA